MKTLWIIRHAKSCWKNPHLKDFDRPLNTRGKRDAPFMGKLLYKNSIRPDAIISSTAKRAKLTALNIANEISFPIMNIEWNSKLYLCSRSTSMNIIENLDSKHNTVFIIGHNPCWTDLSNYLSGEYISNIPTAGMVELCFQINDWSAVSKDLAKINRFEYPKKYLV